VITLNYSKIISMNFLQHIIFWRSTYILSYMIYLLKEDTNKNTPKIHYLK